MLADTDEMTEDMSWPDLKDAIKYMLEESFRQWPSSSTSILHPAATLIPLQSTSMDESTLSSGVNRTFGASSNGHASHADAEENGEADADDNTGDADQIATSTSRADGEGGEFTGENDVFVRELDMQAFFPSKSQPPAQWKGSWGKRIDTVEELNAERRCIFVMLDDFVNQPPFTIQRLSELILRPTEHHHTLPKYVSALKRLLSVTATRDAFPAHPGDEEENIETLSEDEEEMAIDAQTNGSAATMAGRTPSVRSRASSVPGSPISAPLFSPIPFLMRSGDEGMPGGGSFGSVENGMRQMASEVSANEPSNDTDIPRMELGGADRTAELTSDEIDKRAAHDSSGDESRGTLDEDASRSSHEVRRGVTADGIDGEIEIERVPQPVAGVVSQPSSASIASNEPLGVPSGPVDEVDQIGDRHGQLQPVEPGSVAGGARAFSSTTSNVASADTAVAAHGDGQVTNSRKQGAQTSSDTPERTLKRIRSERNLVKSDDHAQAGSDQA
jgi:hypothetical protein